MGHLFRRIPHSPWPWELRGGIEYVRTEQGVHVLRVAARKGWYAKQVAIPGVVFLLAALSGFLYGGMTSNQFVMVVSLLPVPVIVFVMIWGVSFVRDNYSPEGASMIEYDAQAGLILLGMNGQHVSGDLAGFQVLRFGVESPEGSHTAKEVFAMVSDSTSGESRSVRVCWAFDLPLASLRAIESMAKALNGSFNITREARQSRGSVFDWVEGLPSVDAS